MGNESESSARVNLEYKTRVIATRIEIPSIMKTLQKKYLSVPTFLLITLFASWLQKTHAASQPNFIIIFCDDLGYSDIGCFGSQLHRTPNIDKMASEGTRFTSFYVTSGVCSPSRSSLMTGCYPRRINLHQDHAGQWVLFPRGKRGLNPEETTIAEVLKTVGYSTAIIGKWRTGRPIRGGSSGWSAQRSRTPRP